MTVYRTCLPGDLSLQVIAHLTPGDLLVVQTSLGERTAGFFGHLGLRGDTMGLDPLSPWLGVYDDDAGLRFGSCGTWQRLAQNMARPRLRGPVTAACRAVRGGGVALLTREEAPYYGRTEWQPVGHRILAGES